MGLGSWKTAEVEFWSGTATYWYWDPIVIVRFLLRQRAFIEELVYAPIQEYDSFGQHRYSEMHTCDWWWET